MVPLEGKIFFHSVVTHTESASLWTRDVCFTVHACYLLHLLTRDVCFTVDT